MANNDRKGSKSRRISEPDLEVQEKVTLLNKLQGLIQGWEGTQADKARKLDISQPRLNDLLRGRVEKFSLDSLVSLASRSGLQVKVNVQDVVLKPLAVGPSILASEKRPGDSPFPVVPSELRRLDPHQATALFQNLLRSKAIQLGLSPKDVVISGNIYAKDGGIDARIGRSLNNGELLHQGHTHFQIKTGGGCRPWVLSDLKKELFGKKGQTPSKKHLGDAVRGCLNSDGLYVIAHFGHDLLPVEHQQAVDNLRNLLRSCGYKSPRVDVLGQGQLAGEIEQFPSLCIRLFGFSEDPIKTIQAWKTESLMRPSLHLGDEQKDTINQLREAIYCDGIQHVRMNGEPGLGKTRIVLEAVSDELISPTVIYVPSGDEFQRSKLFKELTRGQGYPVTLVIDDCTERDRAPIWAALKGKPSLKLITIHHEPDRSHDQAMLAIRLPRLSDDHVEAILQEYVGKRNDLRNWAEMCSGSPRVAHAVGQNLKENPSDILRPPADVPLWNRFISGNDRDERTVEQNLVVLRHIALFQRFGFEPPVDSEARHISKLVQNVDPSITWGRFQSIVQHFRSRRILQGNHTLVIVPKALHIYLWREFWAHYGRGFDFKNFLSELPESMHDWFLRLFIYADEPASAKEVVKSILAPGGPLESPELLESGIGARIINYLSEADPARTLDLIKRTYGSWSHDQLLRWTAGRQDIVWALEKIIVWRHLFVDATQVLIRMALAENAQNSNNSRGLLLQVYEIGLGWAATQATPDERYSLLEALVTSQDASERELGLEMSKSWLSVRGGSRTIGAEHQGMKPTIEFWKPETYGEVYDAWRKVWRLLAGEISGLDNDGANHFANALINSANGLIYVPSLFDEVMDTLYQIADMRTVAKKQLVRFTVIHTRRRTGRLPDESIQVIQKLADSLVGESLWDRIERFVLLSGWEEDHVYRGEEIIEDNEPAERVKGLAEEVLRDPASFQKLVKQLLVASGHRLPQLGYEIGTRSDGHVHQKELMSALNNVEANGEFLGGFLAGLRSLSSKEWEKEILALLRSDKSRELGLECVFRSGMSRKVFDELISLYQHSEVSSSAFGRYTLRSDSNEIDEERIRHLLEVLLSKPDETSAEVIIHVVYEYYLRESSAKDLPRDLTFTILTRKPSRDSQISNMFGYYWEKVGEKYLDLYPDQSIPLLRSLLTNFDKWYRHSGDRYVGALAEKIVKEAPDEAWLAIREQLEGDGEARHDLIFWLGDFGFEERAKAGPIRYLPVEDVLSWVQESPDRRAYLLLHALPQTLEESDGGQITVRFIETLSDHGELLRSLMSHFCSGGWVGNTSDYLERKRMKARKWAAGNPSPSIRLWLDRFIDYLTLRIDDERIREEREF